MNAEDFYLNESLSPALAVEEAAPILKLWPENGVVLMPACARAALVCDTNCT